MPLSYPGGIIATGGRLAIDLAMVFVAGEVGNRAENPYNQPIRFAGRRAFGDFRGGIDPS
jgi:hypothetical protein